jgi:hypothetical protein
VDGAYPKAAVDVENGLGITFSNCKFYHAGGEGIRIGKGSKAVSIQQSEVTDTSANGISMGELTNFAPAYNDQVGAPTVAYSKVHDLGMEYLGAVGMLAGYVDNARIVRNEIYNLPYTGISLGWGWNDQGWQSGYAHSNEIGWNKIHDTMQVMADGAGIYILGYQGNPASQSTIHDNYLYGTGSQIYLDAGSTYIKVTNNVVAPTVTSKQWLDISLGGIQSHITASGNYAAAGSYVNKGDATSLAVAAATAITGSQVMGWPADAQNIASAAGIQSIPTSAQWESPTALASPRSPWQTSSISTIW